MTEIIKIDTLIPSDFTLEIVDSEKIKVSEMKPEERYTKYYITPYIREDPQDFQAEPIFDTPEEKEEWEDNRYSHKNNNDHYDWHRYLIPLQKWNNIKKIIEDKVSVLTRKRIEYSKTIVLKMLNSNEIENSRLFWDLVAVIEENNLYCVQLNKAISTLEFYVDRNSYENGIRQNLDWNVIREIKCKCKHRMSDHNGSYKTEHCGMGCHCEKLDINEKSWIKLRELSGTLKGLDSVQDVDSYLTNTIPKRPKEDQYAWENGFLKRVSLETFDEDYEVPDSAISCCDGKDPNCCGSSDDDIDDESDEEIETEEIEEVKQKTIVQNIDSFF